MAHLVPDRHLCFSVDPVAVGVFSMAPHSLGACIPVHSEASHVAAPRT